MHCLGQAKRKLVDRYKGGPLEGGGGGRSVMAALLCNQPHLKIVTQDIPLQPVVVPPIHSVLSCSELWSRCKFCLNAEELAYSV